MGDSKLGAGAASYISLKLRNMKRNTNEEMMLHIQWVCVHEISTVPQKRGKLVAGSR
jgi:hypothetical protein